MRHFIKIKMASILSFKGRLRLIFVGLMLICFLGIVIIYQTQSDMRLCFMAPSPSNYEYTLTENKNAGHFLYALDNVLTAAVQPTPGKSIFFHETSCHLKHRSHMQTFFDGFTSSNSPMQPNAVKLNARQACAIESAALHNPNTKIFVLFASGTYLINDTAMPLFDAILSYSNVHLRHLNLWSYAAKTPVDVWLNTGVLFRSRYVLSHVSDFLRYLTLWRYGGTYLDMDVVVLRSMEEIPPNYTGAESQLHLAAGVMNFAATGFGHEVAEHCLMEFSKNFNGNDWGSNGPGVITGVMRKICKLNKDAVIENIKDCNGFHIYNHNSFYAIGYMNWQNFFSPQNLGETMKYTNKSYVVHLWNKFSTNRRIKVGSKVAYAVLAEKHCPKVYAASGEYF